MMILPSRIYAQYRNAPKATAWYNITRAIGGQFVDVFQRIRTSYNIDTAATDELNVIGRIVVQPREYTGQVAMTPGWCAAAVDSPAECGDTSAMCSTLNVEQDLQM